MVAWLSPPDTQPVTGRRQTQHQPFWVPTLPFLPYLHPSEGTVGPRPTLSMLNKTGKVFLHQPHNLSLRNTLKTEAQFLMKYSIQLIQAIWLKNHIVEQKSPILKRSGHLALPLPNLVSTPLKQTLESSETFFRDYLPISKYSI